MIIYHHISNRVLISYSYPTAFYLKLNLPRHLCVPFSTWFGEECSWCWWVCLTIRMAIALETIFSRPRSFLRRREFHFSLLAWVVYDCPSKSISSLLPKEAYWRTELWRAIQTIELKQEKRAGYFDRIDFTVFFYRNLHVLPKIHLTLERSFCPENSKICWVLLARCEVLKLDALDQLARLLAFQRLNIEEYQHSLACGSSHLWLLYSMYHCAWKLVKKRFVFNVLVINIGSSPFKCIFDMLNRNSNINRLSQSDVLCHRMHNGRFTLGHESRLKNLYSKKLITQCLYILIKNGLIIIQFGSNHCNWCSKNFSKYQQNRKKPSKPIDWVL